MADKLTLGAGMFVLIGLVGTLFMLSVDTNYYVCNDNNQSLV